MLIKWLHLHMLLVAIPWIYERQELFLEEAPFSTFAVVFLFCCFSQ